MRRSVPQYSTFQLLPHTLQPLPSVLGARSSAFFCLLDPPSSILQSSNFDHSHPARSSHVMARLGMARANTCLDFFNQLAIVQLCEVLRP